MRQGTALRDYARLESTGRWTRSAGAEAQEVLLSLGESTLILSDLADRPVAHWSLPALRRVADAPAAYAPGPDGGERLVVDDPEMNRALALVIAAAREPSDRRQLRRAAGLGLAALVAVGTIWLLPDALRQQAAAALSPAQVDDLGREVVARMPNARACADPYGMRAMERLARAALGPGAMPVRVVTPGPTGGVVAVPGAILLSARAVAESSTAADLAGRLRAAQAAAETEPPVGRVLDEAGPLALVGLLTTARWPEAALRRYADRAAVMDAAPAAGPAPVEISDADWIALKGICTQ